MGVRFLYPCLGAASAGPVKRNAPELIVPPGIRRLAEIKPRRQQDRVSGHPLEITITAVEPSRHQPTKAESATIGKGEAEIARGEFVAILKRSRSSAWHRPS